jgi:beta-barrel assembly-enhancing protease
VRRRRLHLSIASLVTVSILATACATGDVPSIGAGGQPFRPEADERALWARAEKEEGSLLERAIPYDDPLLEDYLARVGDRLVPEAMRAAGGPGFKIRVLRDPTLNAFAMPNGHLFVHTGLLSRLHNEAQLATILGHEMTHVSHRHALKLSREARHEPVPYEGLGVLSRTAGTILGRGLHLAAVASIHGYGRALERDADGGGMDALVRAGYDPREAPRVFEALREEFRDRGALETFFFGSPLRLSERIDTTRKLVRTTYASAAADSSRVKDTEEFKIRLRSVVRDNAYEDIRAGRFPLAQQQLDRVLAVTPQDPVAHLYYGDLHRLRAQRARAMDDEKDRTREALTSYERAIELDPALAEPHRQLGLLYYQRKDMTNARAAFEEYLALKPAAPDAARIKGYILELDR